MLTDLERIIGLEPMYADWQPAVLAAGRNHKNLERNVRIELTSGVWKTPALPLDESRLVAESGIEPEGALVYEAAPEPSSPQHSNHKFSFQRTGRGRVNRTLDLIVPSDAPSHSAIPRKKQKARSPFDDRAL